MNKIIKILVAMLLIVASLSCLTACIAVKNPNYEKPKPNLVAPSIKLGFKADEPEEVFSETKLEFAKGEKAIGNLAINIESNDNMDKEYVVEMVVKNYSKSVFTQTQGVETASLTIDGENDTCKIVVGVFKGGALNNDSLMQFSICDKAEINVTIKNDEGKIVASKTQVVRYI